MKRIYAIILSIAMLLAMMPTMAGVAFATDAHIHDGVTFTIWTDSTKLPTAAGNYYLDTDVTLNKKWTVSNDITLCLNGHAIKLNYNEGFAIEIQAKGCLHIDDCDTTTKHYFTIDEGGSTPGLWRLTTDVTENVVTGGIITGYSNIASTNNRAVVRNGGTLVLNSGTFVGNTSAREDWLSAIIDNYGGTFYMNGGAIKGNYTATYCLGVLSNTANGLFILGDGVISDNTCTQVCVYNGADALMILNGGQIVDNVTKSHAICNQSGGIQVSGPVAIKDNYLSETGAPGNFISDTSLIVGKDLAGAEIYLENNGFKTTGYSVFNNGVDLTNFFTYDGEAGYKAIVNEIGEIEIVESSVVEPESNHNHTNMTPVSSAASLPTTSGMYYLTDNITLDSAWSITGASSADQVDIRLCLNGYAIDLNNKAININNYATLHIYDCDTTTEHYFDVDGNGLWTLTNVEADNAVSGGIITGYSGAAAIGIVKYGSCIMNGGSVVGNRINRSDYQGGVIRNSGVFVLNRGLFAGNIGESNAAGTICNLASFVMNGGKVSNNYMPFIGGVFNTQSGALMGGIITDNISGSDYSAKNQGRLSIAGPVVIKNNKKVDGTPLNLGVNENNQIAVCGDLTGADIQFEYAYNESFGLIRNETGNQSNITQFFHYDGKDGKKVTIDEKGNLVIEEAQGFHTVKIDSELEKAIIIANTYTAASGTNIELTVNVDAGYKINGTPVCAYNDGEDKVCDATSLGNNQFTFTMPDATVTISAEIVEAPQNTSSYIPYDLVKYHEVLAEAQRKQAIIDAQLAAESGLKKLSEAEVKALVEVMVPTVRTENQSRGIKVYVLDNEEITKFKKAGYTVKYDFYRAESKKPPMAEEYKITKVVNKLEPWYLNTATIKNQKYYYKAVAKVYDQDDNLIATTELTQGKYGCRTRK